MTEPTYALGLLGAIAAVVTMLVVGTFAAAGLIFNGEHKSKDPKAKTSASARRPEAPAAPVASQDGQAV